MLSQFDDLLLLTADDGASAPISPSPTGRANFTNELLEAWYQERHERIETGLFLDEARVLLRSILAEGRVTTTNRRKARRLLRAIRSSSPEFEA